MHKDSEIKIRIPASDKQLFADRAKQLGQTLSEWLRWLGYKDTREGKGKP